MNINLSWRTCAVILLLAAMWRAPELVLLVDGTLLANAGTEGASSMVCTMAAER